MHVPIRIDIDKSFILIANVAGVAYLIPQKAKGEDQKAVFLPRNFGLQASMSCSDNGQYSLRLITDLTCGMKACTSSERAYRQVVVDALVEAIPAAQHPFVNFIGAQH